MPKLRNEKGIFIKGKEIIKLCGFCSKEFPIFPCQIQSKKYCSFDCSNKSKIGKKHSEEHKKKISLNSNPLKGKDNPLYKGGKEYIKQQQKIYQKIYKSRPEIKLLRNHYEKMRVCRKRQSGGSYTLQEWADLKKKYNYMCLCCKKFEPNIKLTADHIIPIKLGGKTLIKNIQPLCQSCNSSKYISIIDYRKLYATTNN